jgi:hypothetical protein
MYIRVHNDIIHNCSRRSCIYNILLLDFQSFSSILFQRSNRQVSVALGLFLYVEAEMGLIGSAVQYGIWPETEIVEYLAG